MKKYERIIIILSSLIMCILLCYLFNSEQIVLRKAEHIIKERMGTQPCNIWLIDYNIEKTVLNNEGKDNIVRIKYDLTYGRNKTDYFIKLYLEEEMLMRKNDKGQWYNVYDENYNIISLDIVDNEDAVIYRIDQSDYVPYMSMDEAHSYVNEREIANSLLSRYVNNLANKETKKSFTPLNGISKVREISLVEKKSGVRNCWSIRCTFDGTFVGYIEGKGYSIPFLWEKGADIEYKELMNTFFYLEEDGDGYRLYSQPHD